MKVAAEQGYNRDMLNNRLAVPCFNALLFFWVGRTGSAFSCDLSISNERGVGQVWNDRADVGFEVISPRTNKVALFIYDGEMKDAEGKVIGWVYRGHGPEHGSLTIEIFND